MPPLDPVAGRQLPVLATFAAGAIPLPGSPPGGGASDVGLAAPGERPPFDRLSDVRRQLEICNACRYCEGYCAVFPAMERRTEFATGDIQFLANLCHDCRECFYACPFAPPHEFAVNLPLALSAVRTETYAEYAPPRLFARMTRAAGSAVGLAVAVSTLIVLALIMLTTDPVRIFEEHAGPGSFYRVVPHLAMALPAMAVSIYGLTVMLVGGRRFWRDTGGQLSEMVDIRGLLEATAEAFTLRYLRGGPDDGCTYPRDRPSYSRFVLHSLVFYGFAAAFASTTIAAIEQEIFGNSPPFDLLSAPVILGSIGGVAMIVGCTGLMWLKLRSDDRPASAVMRSMDFAFLAILNLANISGMLVLALRETALMGTFLVLHLGILGGLYVTAPYGKFAHVVYRYGALVRNRVEARREEAAEGG